MVLRPKFCSHLILLFLLNGSLAWGQLSNVRAIADRVDRHYNHLRAMKAEFSESYRGAGVERTESGILYLQKPGRMRWEYITPRSKLFISDGKQAFFYVPGEAQARRSPLNKLDDLRSPLRYLLGKTKLEKEFEHLELAAPPASSAAGDVIMRGIPHSMADRVQMVELEINQENQIVRILIAGIDGDTTEFHFRNLVENPELSETWFHFAPPNGVQVVEGEELTQ